MIPLIKNFKSTNIFKAFLLNSITSTIIIVLAIEVNFMISKRNVDNEKENKTNEENNILMVVIITFFTTIIAYSIMYLIFGFGGGMITIYK